VIGLNTLQRFSVPKHPQPAPGVGGVYTDTYTPQALWSLYDQPADNLGQGQTMAVIGAGATDSVIGDLRRFEDLNHLPHVPVVVKHAGAGTFKDVQLAQRGVVRHWSRRRPSTGVGIVREDRKSGSHVRLGHGLKHFLLVIGQHTSLLPDFAERAEALSVATTARASARTRVRVFAVFGLMQIEIGISTTSRQGH